MSFVVGKERSALESLTSLRQDGIDSDIRHFFERDPNLWDSKISYQHKAPDRSTAGAFSFYQT